MYTPQDRHQIRSAILDRAAADARLSGVAITGSAAGGREDKWSDIDLAFGVRAAGELGQALADWTEYLYAAHGALHHVDVQAGAWTYRVFLLANALQVDLAFVGAEEFRAMGPDFRLVSGEAGAARAMPEPGVGYLIGFGWLYALHARSSIGRGKVWQAEYMISGVRDTALALACLRHGVPAMLGRGLDQLPEDVAGPFAESLVRSMEVAELTRAFGAAVRLLMAEIRMADGEVGARVEGVMMGMI